MTATPESRTALDRRTRNAERAAATAVDVAAREVDRRFELEQSLGWRARRRLARIRQGSGQ